MNRPRYCLSENSITFALVIDPLYFLWKNIFHHAYEEHTEFCFFSAFFVFSAVKKPVG